MPARQESCCFTGHRPAKLPWGYNESDPRCVKLKERIADAVLLAYQEGYRHFLCGIFISEHPGQDECHARRNQEHDNIVQWIIQTKQQSKDTGYSGTGCTQSHNGSIQCSAGTAYCTTDERPEEP